MGKPTFCICKNKGSDQLCSNGLCFRFTHSAIPPLPISKISSFYSFLRLYRLVCFRPVQKPYYWFSHETAQIKAFSVLLSLLLNFMTLICRTAVFTDCLCNTPHLMPDPTTWGQLFKITMLLAKDLLKFQRAILQIHYYFLLIKCKGLSRFINKKLQRILTFYQQKITVYLFM